VIVVKSQVSGPLSKREYKDEEKKVIKNKNFYCLLILFYIYPFSYLRNTYDFKYLIYNKLKFAKIRKHHKDEYIII